MMSAISSSTAPGTPGMARANGMAGAGDSMASAFAMLFALMPGIGDDSAGTTGDALPKKGDGDAKDGSKSETDGKDLPSDATALPLMAMPMPVMALPVTPVPTPAPEPQPAPTDVSAAPIATLLAAMPTLPGADAPAATPKGQAATDTKTTPIATRFAAMPALPDADAVMPPHAKTAADVEAAPVATRFAAMPPLPDAGAAIVPPPDGKAATDAKATSTSPAQSLPPGMERTPEAIASVPLAARIDPPRIAVPVTTPVQPSVVSPHILLPPESVPVARPTDIVADPRPRQDMPIRFAVTPQTNPVVAPLPVQAPAPLLQPGQTVPAIQLLGLSMREPQGGLDPLSDRRKDEPRLSLDPAALTRADSLTAAPVAAMTGAEQAPLDMTQAHWPQGMIDRIDRMREDAATADTRIQLSPDALGGIAVKLRHEDGRTHIHFTADQAQTATMLADAQPMLSRLAEEKGMRLGQTAVDLGQSGAGGERQAPPRRPEPVLPSRPAFAGTPSSSDAGDPVAASTRIA